MEKEKIKFVMFVTFILAVNILGAWAFYYYVKMEMKIIASSTPSQP